MQTFRGSLAHIPYTVSKFIGSNMSISSPSEGGSQVTESGSIASNSMYLDDSLDKSHAIPSSLIKEEWQLILDQDASVGELSKAIDLCKELVINTEECSSERNWIVRHLVELRFRLREMEDSVCDSRKRDSIYKVRKSLSVFEKCNSIRFLFVPKVILGHHFIVNHGKHTQSPRLRCDHCSGIIWNVVQASYICEDCGFCVHLKCVENVLRVCAHVVASDRKEPIDEICLEIGLSFQEYKCAECQASLSFSESAQPTFS